MAKGRQGRRPKAPATTPGLSLPTKAVPKKALDPPTDNVWHQLLIVRFDRLDLDGPWSIVTATAAEILTIFQAVTGFEQMTVGQAFSGYPGKDYEVAKIPNPDAVRRLEQLGLDDQTTISALRLGARPRLYGMRNTRYFHALWWDPLHLIWPTEPRNT